ncbi:MAG: purine-binding chemotaxis protein CheW [Limisphaerales bacterium]|nr:MAG: purine-binding chemotaxis protein CheW [Limisphaerales bacterium]
MSTVATLDKPAASALSSLAGKYLTFTLGRESYGVSVLKVREIIRLCPVTPVPQMPEFVKGVVNLRGKIVPLIDLRLKFHLPHAGERERTCIVVVEVQSPVGKLNLGLLVDGVEEVAHLTPADLEPTPDFGTSLSTEYILGMAKLKGCVKTLLDIDRVLAAQTIEHMQRPAA